MFKAYIEIKLGFAFLWFLNWAERTLFSIWCHTCFYKALRLTCHLWQSKHHQLLSLDTRCQPLTRALALQVSGARRCWGLPQSGAEEVGSPGGIQPTWPCSRLLVLAVEAWARDRAMKEVLCFPGEIVVSFTLLIDLLIALISYWLLLCRAKDGEVRWCWVTWLSSLYWDLAWHGYLKQWLGNLGCFLSREWWQWGNVSR